MLRLESYPHFIASDEDTLFLNPQDTRADCFGKRADHGERLL